MEKDQLIPYEAPKVEVLQISVEQGFATSTGGSWGNADWQEGEKDWFN